MKPYTFCILALLSCIHAFADQTNRSNRSGAKEKPNLLFIFTDDQSHETIHAYGNKEIITPHMDRLVNDGTSFMNAYNMGSWSGAVCIASRTMINTGLSVWNANAAFSKLNDRAEKRQLWSQLLEDAGYETYMTGKWHVKVKADSIFNHVLNERPGMPNQTQARYKRDFTPGNTDWLPWDPKHEGFWKGGKHWSEVLADDALTFLKQAKNNEKPFFMYLAFNAPHDPRQAPKEYIDMYPLDKISTPKSYQPIYPYAQEIGCHMKEITKNGKTTKIPQRDESLAPWPRTEYSVKVNKQEYYALVTHTDAQIGRILDALEKTGKMDNTYIFFTADHGLAIGNHGLLGKQNMYEHSVKPPLVVVGPDIPADKKCETMVYLQDIMATTLDLAGATKPAYVEFNSLMPYIKNKDSKGAYDAIYGAFLAKQRMINDGKYKLIAYPEAQVIRLFNIKKDPLEINDLASNPEQENRIKKLFEKLQKLQQQFDDPLDLTTAFPDLD